jgi:serine/threonine protein kinase
VDVDQVVGGYRLRNLIATGQSSQVWEVVEMSSSRHMAMKTLLPEASKDREQRRMLLHEAAVGQKLAHPNIVKILKISSEPKKPIYMIMEFFPAGSMKFRIINKQTDFIKEHGLAIFKQIATALAYMNTSGWLHRDVKPDNMLANSLGEAKLIDFAIAARIKKSGFLARLFRRRGKTIGTRSYMSPEQIRGEDLDARADIYSFGASLYEIVTLRPPFRGASSQDLLNKHLHEKPLTPQSHNPDVTDDFAKFVLEMLAKKKQERPNNFHEILMKLKTIRVFKSGSGKEPAISH